VVDGVGSTMEATTTHFNDNAACGVSVMSGAVAILSACYICKNGWHGLSVADDHTHMKAEHSHFAGNQRSNVMVEKGARCDLQACEVYQAKLQGIQVANSTVVAKDCKVLGH
jgi:hypothetical protein